MVKQGGDLSSYQKVSWVHVFKEFAPRSSPFGLPFADSTGNIQYISRHRYISSTVCERQGKSRSGSRSGRDETIVHKIYVADRGSQAALGKGYNCNALRMLFCEQAPLNSMDFTRDFLDRVIKLDLQNSKVFYCSEYLLCACMQ